MDVDSDERLEEILCQAVEIESADERQRFLDQACAGDATLRSRVDELIRNHFAAGDFLGHPAIGHTQLLDDTAGDAECHNRPVRQFPDVGLDFLKPSAGPLGQLGQYEILETVGRGGMGIVFKAQDTKLNRIVAIKVLAPELASHPTAHKRFLREARAAAAVSHDHIVTIHAVEENDGKQSAGTSLPYLVMEFIDGQSLQQRLEGRGTLDLKEILRIGRQIAAGLAAAHEQGLIHRDVKPANILLQNHIERVKITDFGLARAADDVNMTRTGEIAGTPQYMSPEQAKSLPLDPRSDLFSLGSVLYAMCTGRSPFHADTPLGSLRRVCDEAPTPIQEINPSIPESLVSVINRLLAKNATDRYESADEVVDLLGQQLAQLQQSISPAQGTTTAPRVQETDRNQPARHRRSFVAATISLSICVLAGLVLTEKTGVTRVSGTLSRLFIPEKSYRNDEVNPSVPATQPISDTDRGNFLLRAGDDVRRFNTLSDAVLSAGEGDTIEISGNGPYNSPPIKITRPLEIRAANGFRPVIQLSPEAVLARSNLLEVQAPLILEGLELQVVAKVLDERHDPWQSVIHTKAPIHIANCRLLFQKSRGNVIDNRGPICELRNCEVIYPAGHGISSYLQPQLRLHIDNSCLMTGIVLHYGQFGTGEHAGESTFRLRRNTFVTQQQPIVVQAYLDKLPRQWTEDQNVKPLRLETDQNIFDSRSSVMLFVQIPPGKILAAGDAESALPKIIGWHGTRNAYAVDGPFLGLGIHPKQNPDPANPIRSTAEWGAFWGANEVGATDGQIKYQSMNLPSRLAAAPEKVTTEDFRLSRDSTGYQGGIDGKDIGADLDLVGPGPAYERWKKLPDYLEWLRVSGQLKPESEKSDLGSVDNDETRDDRRRTTQ